MIRLKHLITEQTPIGSGWNACKRWKSSGGTSYWNGEDGRPEIFIEYANNEFLFAYTGKNGYVIATPENQTDSLHQLFNIILCEMNPILIKGGLKPDIKSITANCTYFKEERVYDLNVSIPLIEVDANLKYQIDRRGGWGHTGGKSDLPKAATRKNYEGPHTVVINDGNGRNITEYFVTYTV